MGTPDPSTDTKAETMRIASKVGIVLATVGMTIGLLGGPANAVKPDSGWPKSGDNASAKYIP
jgi:hypothetical protein